jgi:hypothetical protein
MTLEIGPLTDLRYRTLDNDQLKCQTGSVIRIQKVKEIYIMLSAGLPHSSCIPTYRPQQAHVKIQVKLNVLNTLLTLINPQKQNNNEQLLDRQIYSNN